MEAKRRGPEVAGAQRSAVARQRWRRARLFEEQVQRALVREQVCFVEWLLLETLSELLDETSGWVSQRMIAQRAGLSERVLSHWMSQLSDFNLVDRAPEENSRTYAVLLTDLGRRTVEACNERLEAAGLTG